AVRLRAVENDRRLTVRNDIRESHVANLSKGDGRLPFRIVPDGDGNGDGFARAPPGAVNQPRLNGHVGEKKVLDNFGTASLDTDAAVAVGDDDVLKCQVAHILRRGTNANRGGAAAQRNVADRNVFRGF